MAHRFFALCACVYENRSRHDGWLTDTHGLYGYLKFLTLDATCKASTSARQTSGSHPRVFACFTSSDFAFDQLTQTKTMAKYRDLYSGLS